jgi:hypothetical protein
MRLSGKRLKTVYGDGPVIYEPHSTLMFLVRLEMKVSYLVVVHVGR